MWAIICDTIENRVDSESDFILEFNFSKDKFTVIQLGTSELHCEFSHYKFLPCFFFSVLKRLNEEKIIYDTWNVIYLILKDVWEKLFREIENWILQ